MSLLSMMSDRALIERSTPTATDSGESRHSWTTIASSQRCKLRSLGERFGATRQEPGGIMEDAEFSLLLPKGADIKPAVGDGGLGDRVTINSVIYMVAWVVAKENSTVAYLRRQT